MRYLSLLLLLSIALGYGAASLVELQLSGHLFIPKEQELEFNLTCDGKEFETYYECYNNANVTIFTPSINTYDIYEFKYYIMRSNISLEEKEVKIEVDGEPPVTNLYAGWSKSVNFSCFDRSGCAYTIFKVGNESFNVTGPFPLNCSGTCVFNATFYSVDVYGNKEEEKNGIIKIDLEAPILVWEGREYYKPGLIKIKYNVSDSGAGFDHLLVDGEPKNDISIYATKDTVVEVTVFDKLGNGRTYRIPVKVDGEPPVISIENTYCGLECEPVVEVKDRALSNVSKNVTCKDKACVICVLAYDKAGNEAKECKEVEYITERPTVTYTIGNEVEGFCNARECRVYAVTNEGNKTLPFPIDHSIYIEKICASNPNGVACERVDKWVHKHIPTGYIIMPSKSYGFAVIALVVSIVLGLLLWRFK